MSGETLLQLLAEGGLTAIIVGVALLGLWRGVGKAWATFQTFLERLVGSVDHLSAEIRAQAVRHNEQHAKTVEVVGEMSERIAAIEVRVEDKWDEDKTPVRNLRAAGRYNNSGRDKK